MKKFAAFVSFLPYLLVFISSMFDPSDPDLGWHLKYGEYFFKNGHILRDNTFSTMMPEFKWANVSWGTDVITYAAYSLGGFFGLTLAGALVVTLTFLFFSKAARLTLWDQTFLFPLLLYLESPINSVSFRGQQISLMFVGVLMYVLSLYEKRKKILFLLIPLFFLWGNLHGQFFLGLIILAIWIGIYVLQLLLTNIDRKKIADTFRNNFVTHKNEVLYLFLIFSLSLFVTFINPFGAQVHQNALDHIGSPLLKNVGEYLPFVTLSKEWWNQVVVAMLITMGLTAFFFRNKLRPKLPVLGLTLLLFVLSFNVRRYAWPAYYLILPLLKPIPGFLKPDRKNTAKFVSFVLLSVIIVVTLFSKNFFTDHLNYSWDDYCRQENVRCSRKSAEFLIENNLTDDLYSLYGWGGYLIWNYPQIKPAIDGRMHIWMSDSGYSAFEEYYAFEQDLENIDTSKYNVVYMYYDKPVYGKLIKLVNQGKWNLVYKDDYAGIFVREDKSTEIKEL